MRRALVLLLALALTTTACSIDPNLGDGDLADEPAIQPTAVATAIVDPAPTAIATPAETPADEADAPPDEIRAQNPEQVLSIVLQILNGERELSPAEYESLFTSGFRDAVPYPSFTQFNQTMGASGPWKRVEALEVRLDRGTFMVSTVRDELFTVNVVLVGEQVSGLLLQSYVEPPDNFDDAVALLEQTGRFVYLIAEVDDDGSCRRVDEQDADRAFPLGSLFKLLVLGALVDAVEAGTIEWDAPVTIRDELDSYPSGTFQDIPAGETRTVREMAEAMISISDNTATDHLIDLIGREVVESAQAAWGVTTPDLNIPFLTTRETFQIKLDNDLSERWINADAQQRREILDEVASLRLAPLNDVVESWTQPRNIETIEWFASPADLCRVLARLARNDEAREILEENPGIPSNHWSTVGFKGGSEPGVIASAWIVTGEDGRTWTVTAGVWNSDEAFAGAQVVPAIAAMRDTFTTD